MKIIHITPSYKPAYLYGGPTYSVAKLCEALAQQKGMEGNQQQTRDDKSNTTHADFDIQVLTTTANGSRELDVPTKIPQTIDGVSVTYFKRLTKDHTHFSPSLLIHLRKMLNEAKQNNLKVVIHIHAWWNLVSVLSCLVAKRYKTPIVLSPRGMVNVYSNTHKNSKMKTLLNFLLANKLLKYCLLHLTSEKERTELPKFIDLNKTTLIPNLANLRRPALKNLAFAEAYKTSSNGLPLKLIFLSRIDKIKGLDILFLALTHLKLDWQLTIAGTGEEKYVDSLKELATKLEIDNNISWLGQVGDEKFDLLAIHDVLVLTSYTENFANVVVESLSVGTPVLISEHVGLADYVNENGFGWITNLQPEKITKTLMEAAKDLKKRQHIRISAPQKITEDFDDGTLAKRYLRMYEDVLNFGQR